LILKVIDFVLFIWHSGISPPLREIMGAINIQERNEILKDIHLNTIVQMYNSRDE